VDDIALVNIVAGRRLVREFVQQQARPAEIAAELIRLVREKDYADRVRSGLVEVKQRLGPGGANRQIAKLVAEMLVA